MAPSLRGRLATPALAGAGGRCGGRPGGDVVTLAGRSPRCGSPRTSSLRDTRNSTLELRRLGKRYRDSHRSLPLRQVPTIVVERQDQAPDRVLVEVRFVLDEVRLDAGELARCEAIAPVDSIARSALQAHQKRAGAAIASRQWQLFGSALRVLLGRSCRRGLHVGGLLKIQVTEQRRDRLKIEPVEHSDLCVPCARQFPQPLCRELRRMHCNGDRRTTISRRPRSKAGRWARVDSATRRDAGRAYFWGNCVWWRRGGSQTLREAAPVLVGRFARCESSCKSYCGCCLLGGSGATRGRNQRVGERVSIKFLPGRADACDHSVSARKVRSARPVDRQRPDRNGPLTSPVSAAVVEHFGHASLTMTRVPLRSKRWRDI